MDGKTFISDEDVERALFFLRDNAEEAAKARAERIYVEEFRKSLKALIMKEFDDDSGIIQERNAYSDPRYVSHLAAIRDAVFKDEKCRFLRIAAEAKIEAWRTASSNWKAMKL